MPEPKSFWNTLPGIIAGVAAIVSGLGVLIPVLVHLSHSAAHHPTGARAAATSTPSPGGSSIPEGAGSSPGSTGGAGSPTDTGVPASPGYMDPGTGSTGGLTATPSTLDFGQAALGSSSSIATTTVTNAGSGSATIAGIELKGPQAGQFSIASSTCGSGAVLAPGGSCQVGVRFNASAVGSAAASLVITLERTQSSIVMIPINGTVGLL
jgi:hypothetical protein